MAKAPADLQFRKEDFAAEGLSTRDSLDKLFQPLNQWLSSAKAALSAGLTVRENSASEVVTLSVIMPSSPWAAVSASSFLNGWSNTGSFTTAYRAGTDGRVYVRGNVSSGTANSVIFALPAALRPPQDMNFATESASVFGKVVVEAATGNVRQAAGGANLSLDCISFEPASPVSYVPNCFPAPFKLQRLTAPLGFRLLRVQDVTPAARSATAPVALSLGAPDVQYRGGLDFALRNLSGLQHGRTYSVILEAVA